MATCKSCNQEIEWDEDVSRAICANIGRMIKNKPPPLNPEKTGLHDCPNYNKGGGSSGGSTQLASFPREKVEPITMIDATDMIKGLRDDLAEYKDLVFKKLDGMNNTVDLLAVYVKAGRVDDFEKRLSALEVKITTIAELVTAMADSDPHLHELRSASEIAGQK